MEYKATIHTMEIEPVLRYPDEWRSWISKAYEANCPCVSQLYPGRYGSMPKLVINTHRLHEAPDGKYSFTYMGLQEHKPNISLGAMHVYIKNAMNRLSFIFFRSGICAIISA